MKHTESLTDLNGDEGALSRSQLIANIAERSPHMTQKDIDYVVRTLLESMSSALEMGKRIEIRGFGTFTLSYRAPRVGRNPKTGEAVHVSAKCVPHFKPGKTLRSGIENAFQNTL